MNCFEMDPRAWAQTQFAGAQLGDRRRSARLVTVAAQIAADQPTAAPSPRPDPILRLGEASFGVYLCWIFVELALVAELRAASPGPAGRVALMAAAFLACLAAGWLAWRFVEVPAQRWVLLLGRRRPAGALLADRP